MTFPSIRIEGAILSGDLLAKLDKGDFVGQRPADFGFDSQAKLKEEIVRAWTAGQAFYTAFQHKLEGVKGGTAATSETRNQWIIPLLGLLGYAELEFQLQSELVGDKPFRISHRLRSHGGFAVSIVGARESLDKKATTGQRVSPHGHLQEYLNLKDYLYGIVTNGKVLRLLRNSTRLIKLSYVEFDLDRMFSEELFADFAVLYRLLHVTRLPKLPEKSAESLLERYHQDALESGARIRDGLSVAVEQVLQELGSGFLARNENLQTAIANNSVTARELHHGLLRLIYRLLLMMVAEERGLLFAEAATLHQRKLYADYYSITRLRRLAERRALVDPTKHDLWRGLRSTFRLFETDGPGAPLGLTGLGGQLFSASALGPLQSAELDNGTLLSALAKLSLFRQPDTGQFSRVNYGALATEEFGSVYERLLELHPVINPAVGNLPPTFGFKQAAGNERKTTGSYYTPSSLVECLLDSALDPVLDQRVAEASAAAEKLSKAPTRPPSPLTERSAVGGEGRGEVGFIQLAEQAILSLKVCDPACGSGHFLIAAAQRIARRLALLRSKGDEPSVSELHHTLREVISHCIYGVDINPMSVELCKVALWLEAMEAGKPLSFLDHHIRCGNSLLGATPELIAKGIPDDAFTAIEGDDKKACAALKKLNARERAGFGELFALEDRATFDRLQQAAVAVENLPDDSVRAVEQKSAAFDQLQHNYDLQKATDLANLWCAAFVIRKRMADELPSANGESAAASQPKTESAAPSPEQTGLFGETFAAPATKEKKSTKATAASALAEAVGVTSGHLRDFAKGAALPDGMMSEVQQLSGQYNFFHWHLVFPEVFKHHGFDLVLGNPPWERVKLQEKEWFAERRPDIANAANAATRKRLIEELITAQPGLFQQFKNDSRRAEGESHLLRDSAVFPLCGCGDINLYAVFAERMRNILNRFGRVGAVLPSEIGTADTTKLFLQSLVKDKSLVSFFSFENEEFLFPGVHHAVKFCLLTIAGAATKISASEFIFYARQTAHLEDQARRFTLAAEDISLINPNTLTCPVFRTSRDAELAKAIYRKIPVLISESPEEKNPWGLIIRRVFDMNKPETLELCLANKDKGDNLGFVPMLEAKLVHQYDHRFASYVGEEAEPISNELKKDASEATTPRYWISESDLSERLSEFWNRNWLLAWRDITNTTNEHTVIAAVLPKVGTDFTLRVGFPKADDVAVLFVANLNAFVFEYCARQSLGGTHLSDYILKQLPFIPPTDFIKQCAWSSSQLVKDWLLPRVLELTYTAWDLEAFAQDCGWFGPPFRWDEERRFQLRCELDAAFFHLYGLNRDDTAYILDTFPIVKRKDEEKSGTYRTKENTLALYDALAECQRTGQAFVSPLNPAPASLTAAHPWNWEGKPLKLPTTPRTPLPEVWQYVVTVMTELLWQAGGSLPWRILRTATDLLSDRKRLAQLGELHVGQVALDWLKLNGDSFDATHRWDQLSGFCTAGKIRVVRRNDELVVELLSADGHVYFPHVRFDARLALTVARNQPATKPTPAEAREDRRVEELITT
jgi:hypothetical protein